MVLFFVTYSLAFCVLLMGLLIFYLPWFCSSFLSYLPFL